MTTELKTPKIPKPAHCPKCGAGHVTDWRRSKFGRKLSICRKCSRKEDRLIQKAA